MNIAKIIFRTRSIEGGVHLSTIAFLTLAVLFVVPWVLLALHTHDHSHNTSLNENPASGDPATPTPTTTNVLEFRTGPWGRLAATPMIISPLDSALPAGWSRPTPTTWLFAGHTRSSLAKFLASLNLFEDEKSDLLDATRWQVETDGIRIAPRPETILSLDPVNRLKLFAELAKHPSNQSYYQPWSLRKSTFESALNASALSDATREMIRNVALPSGQRIFVADAATVVGSITNEQEKLRAIRFLKSAETYVVSLHVDPDTDLQQLLSYWGGHANRDQIRPILESTIRSGQAGVIDLLHLLPDFASDRLYTYPDAASAADGVRRDCHWSSLNFFAATPDDRLGESTYVQEFVMKHYYQSADAPAFGDIIFFTTRDEQTIHSAVYLAGNLAFTKNGDDHLQPWMIMDLDDLQELYSAYSRSGVTRQTWKLKE